MKTKLKKGEIVARNMTLLTLLLSLFKAVIGYFSGSISLIADAIHGFIDTISIFASWFGLKISQRKPDQTFPYGYYKAENLTTLLISLIIAYTSYEIFIESIHKLTTTPSLKYHFWALSISLISTITSYFIYRYEKKTAKEINSSSLSANADESRTDIYTSFLVFLSILASTYKIKYIESIAGIILALLILTIAIKNMKISILSLMDATPDKKTYNNIKEILKNHKKIKTIKSLKLRQSGPLFFGEATLTLNKNYSLEESHKITEEIENKIKSIHPEIDSLLIHTEPEEKSTLKIIIPVENNKEDINQKINPKFAQSPYYAIISYDKSKSAIKKIKTIQIENKPKIKKGLYVSKKLLKYKPDIIITKELGDVSKALFKGNNIKIIITKKDKIKDALSLIR